MASSIKKLLFVDTNIWLDFYRTRNDVGLTLLSHIEAIADRVIVTFQLESEFKKNRQIAILEGMQELKAPTNVPRPGMFSDSSATKVLSRNLKEAEKRVRNMKARLALALNSPSKHDPVYQACQRIFHRADKLVLTRENALRHLIRRKALRRFMHGCPPRKRGDTSFGDAFNWEWMIHCANAHNAELVIVSRDSDYGVVFDDKGYINDHLRQEFSERVSNRRELLLYTRLSDALKHFKIAVSAKEVQAEKDIASDAKEVPASPPTDLVLNVLEAIQKLNVAAVELREPVPKEHK